MEKIDNLIGSVTGQEQIGFLDTSQSSLYCEAWTGDQMAARPSLTKHSRCGRNSLQSHFLEVSDADDSERKF